MVIEEPTADAEPKVKVNRASKSEFPLKVPGTLETKSENVAGGGEKGPSTGRACPSWINCPVALVAFPNEPPKVPEMPSKYVPVPVSEFWKVCRKSIVKVSAAEFPPEPLPR